MSENIMHHIEIKQSEKGRFATKIMLDGKELHKVTRIAYSASIEEMPLTEISMLGFNDIDIHDCFVKLDITPTNLQEAVVILMDELKKHGDLYAAFWSSIASSIKENTYELSQRDEYGLLQSVNEMELAEKILRRIIGEE